MTDSACSWRRGVRFYQLWLTGVSRPGESHSDRCCCCDRAESERREKSPTVEESHSEGGNVTNGAWVIRLHFVS